MKWLVSVLVAISLASCTQTKENAMQAGGLYSIDDGEGSFKIAKILAISDDTVHIRLYKNAWKERPSSVVPPELSLGTINDDDGFGIGHLPLSLEAFKDWSPALLQVVEVTEEELEGYRMWQDANGGTF